jgi:histidinol-phosphate aminotransferase
MDDRVSDLIRPEVRALESYRVGIPPHRIKLNQNESSIELPHPVKEEIVERVRVVPWSRYPQQARSELGAALREALNLPEEIEIVTGNGSNELIQALFVAVLGPGEKIVIPVPTFLLYRQFAAVLGAEVIDVPLDVDLGYDVERILEAIKRAEVKAVVFARPNNPTGTSISIEAVERLLENVAALVVVDEAYAEFAGDTVLTLLPEHANLVVLRTFSKALRSAGLRIGYLLAHSVLTEQIVKVLPPFNTSIVSCEAALSILRHRALLRPGLEQTLAERDRMLEALDEIRGITPVPSEANFICFRTEKPPRSVFDRLLDRGILVRDISGYPLLADCLRVSVGTSDENRAFVTALKEIMEER